jgi:hypothetical protein
MQIDLSLIPSTFDAVHAGLAVAVVVLLVLQVLFLTLGVIALLRRRPAGPLAVAVERMPAEMSPPGVPSPVRVVVEKLPPEFHAANLPPREAPKQVEAPKTFPALQVVREATPEAALQLLGLLQKEARFLDFVQENISSYGDEDIGAAARVVHEGCRKVLKQHFDLAPIRQESENSRITLPKGFDAASIRPVGNVAGSPPFTGTLIHRGWRATGVKLPKIAEGHDLSILAQAEVEL